MTQKILVALGGNAILTDDPTANGQMEALEKTAKQLTRLVESGYQLIISHGNGPQVGNLLLQQAAAHSPKNPALPLDTCVAMTQGSIGYWLQNRMQDILNQKGIDKKVATVLTQVEVSADDPAFVKLTKPIGPFLTQEDAARLHEETGDQFIEDSGRGYRKVVASPKPVNIVESDVIQLLVDNEIITIACGGGGIPLVRKDGQLKGVEAVIDKDFASAKLAEILRVDKLIILTGVDNVYVNFNQPNQEKLERVTISQLEQYIDEKQFAEGSMLPKVKAAIDFVTNYPEGEAVITSLENIESYLSNGTGTRVVR
ncbi:carbamate kinase [Carnobacteriaceae bacterium zg-C25]|nr:carbamate kinase [Carnobacteriaceae bacterium zg-ZUI240]QTU82919.1 carbamate kinase [Carnobacteriaceae bacterium zg-C25]